MRQLKSPYKNKNLDFETYAGVVANLQQMATTQNVDQVGDKYKFRVGKVIKNNLNLSYEIGEVFFNKTESEWQFVGNGGWWWATNTAAVPYQSQRFEDASTLNGEVLTVGDLVHVYSDPRSRTWHAVPAPKGWKQLLIRTSDYLSCVYSSYLPDSRFAYIMDGVDDHLDIQSALNEIKDNGGRIFYYGNNSYLSGTVSCTDIKENMVFVSVPFRDVPFGTLKAPSLNANATYTTGFNLTATYWDNNPTLLFYNFNFQNQPATQVTTLINTVNLNLEGYLLKSYGYQNVKNYYIFSSGYDSNSRVRINLTNCNFDGGGITEQQIAHFQYCSDVIIDTCSFANTNPTFTTSEGRCGIYAYGCDNVRVKTTTVEDCAGTGVFLGASNLPVCRNVNLDTVKSTSCNLGAQIYCDEASLISCNTSYNVANGITLSASRDGVIKLHASKDNGAIGINTNCKRIESCTCTGNVTDGIRLIGSIEHIKNTSCTLNNGAGLNTNNLDVDKIEDSTFSTNGTHGIDGTGAGADVLVIKDCVASSNTSTGISLKNVDTITNTTCSSNGGNGFACTSIMNMYACTASSNTGNGISCSDCGKMVKCTTSSNTVNGVGAVNGGSITAPTATGNGGVDFAFSGCGAVINHTGTITTSGNLVLLKVDAAQTNGTIDLTTATSITIAKTGIVSAWS